MAKEVEGIGWSSVDEDELNMEKVAHDEVSNIECVGCCDTSFHVVTSEDEFQELLKGLNSEGGF